MDLSSTRALRIERSGSACGPTYKHPCVYFLEVIRIGVNFGKYNDCFEKRARGKLHNPIIDSHLTLRGFRYFPKECIFNPLGRAMAMQKACGNVDARLNMGQKEKDSIQKFRLDYSLKEMEKIYNNFLQ